MTSTNVPDLDNADRTEFDSKTHTADGKKEFDLKKQNIKKVFGGGKGLLSLVSVGVVFIGFLIYGITTLTSSPKKNIPPPNGAAAVLAVPSGVSDANVATNKEADARRLANNERSAEAKAEGGMFIAPAIVVEEKKIEFSDGKGNSDLSATKTKDVHGTGGDMQNDRAKAEREMAGRQNGSAGTQVPVLEGLSQKEREDIIAETKRQVYQSLGRPETAEQGRQRRYFETVQYALPDRTVKEIPLNAGVSPSTSATNPNAGKSLIIGAGETAYCQIEFVLNSDSPRNEAFATCLSGKANHSRLIGKYEMKENAGDGLISVLFQAMSFPGRPSIPIQAIAMDENTGEVGMADSQDSHTFSKYGGLAVASFLRGVGQAAQMVTGTTSTVSTGITGTSITTVPPISGQRQVAIALGSTGTAVAESIQHRADSIKSTVKVLPKPVLIKFLQDVYE